jgi:SAM-dependent methyltransferase
MQIMLTVLHVGCGPQKGRLAVNGFGADDWRELRLDIDPAAEPDIIGTMTDMADVATQSVDAIFSSHNIEHLYAHEVPVALAEFVRVLKPEGFLVVTCPDLQSVCALVADDQLAEAAYVSPAGPIAPLDILFGLRTQMAQGNLYMAHRFGFTKRTLTETLGAAGFQTIACLQRAASFDLWAVASKNILTGAEITALAQKHIPNLG